MALKVMNRILYYSEVNRKPMHRGPERGDMSKQPSNTILELIIEDLQMIYWET